MSFTEKLIVKVDAVTGGAIRDLQGLSAESTALAAATGQANAQASKGRAFWNQYGGTIKAAGVGVAAVGLAAFKAADVFADLAGEVRKFRDISGESAETSSRWVAVMDDFDIASSSGARALRQLGTVTRDGGTALQDFGVSVRYAKDGTTDLQGTVENIAEAYKHSNDAAYRSSLLAAAFGKRVGSELIPILEKGRKGIRDLFAEVPKGQIFSDEDLAKARRFQLAVDNLQDSVREVVIAFGEAAAGPITTFANGLAGVIRGVKELNDETHGLLSPFGMLPTTLSGAGTAAADLSSTFEKQLLKQLANAEEGSKRYNQAFRTLKQLHSDAIPPTGALGDGIRKLTQGLDAEAAGANAAAAAIYNKIAADLAATGSTLSVEAAQKNYNEALYEHGSASLEARTAENNLEIAAANAALKTRGHEAAQRALGQILGQLPPKVQAVIDKINQVPRSKQVDIYVRAVGLAESRAAIQSYFDSHPLSAGIYLGGSYAAPRQFGGPVSAGAPYVVGERGPELFVPGASGAIVPNGRMGGGTVVNNFNIGGSVLAERELKDLLRELSHKDARQGRSWN